MKYIYQLGIILGVSFAAEILHNVLPLPVPASIYGLLLLLLLLFLRIVRLEQIEETADYFLLVMPLMFVEPTVKLMTVFDIIKGALAPLLAVSLVSALAVLLVTGKVSQYIIRRKKARKRE